MLIVYLCFTTDVMIIEMCARSISTLCGFQEHLKHRKLSFQHRQLSFQHRKLSFQHFGNILL